MYSVHAYYLAGLASVFSLIWIYPVFSALPAFYFYGLEASSFPDLLNYIACCYITSLAGGFFGFMIGCQFSVEIIGLNVCGAFVGLWNLTSGCYVNTGKGADWDVKALTRVSPLRYGTELLLRSITEGRKF